MQQATNTFFQNSITEFEEKQLMVTKAFYDIASSVDFMPEQAQTYLRQIEQLENKEHQYHIESQAFRKNFETIQQNDYNNFASNYQQILDKLEEKDRKSYGGYWDKATANSLKMFQESLRSSWNNFIGHFSSYENLRLPNENQPLFDIRV
ncbi:hypothetical protein SH601_03205 [Gracilibacillus sp. S3-1-1]|uniref:Uncharacterized protein n=1 Tax=Gracilibacillus pellucidus TaxID=3095368 RepID=A0ACC6M1Z6_9BACI|nr:hypothetical protein [Gracilibacillus sp. S3-1-1]MDX8044983.1 hypothetical protein [Gracilibacillus sp. S3-1-1]